MRDSAKVPAFAILSFCALSGIVHASNDRVPDVVKVSTVTFSEGTGLQNDVGGDIFPAANSPHWEDKVNNSVITSDPNYNWPDGNPDEVAGVTGPNRVKSYAYSYASNKSPKVGAVFKWKSTPPQSGAPYYAKGEVVDTPNSAFTLKKVQLAGDTTYPATSSDETIVLNTNRRIQAYVTSNRKVTRSDGTTDLAAGLQPLTIQWTVIDTNGKEYDAGRSTHTIYVTWDAPSTALRQETLFNLACETANGMTVDANDNGKAVFDRIWSEFEDREVKKMDGTIMNYWGNENFLNTNTIGMSIVDLLSYGAGRCEAWALFLIECAKIQTLNSQSQVLIFAYPAIMSFHVPINGNVSLAYGVCGVQQVTFTGSIRMKPIPGQGNINPPAPDLFVSHAAVGWDVAFPQLPGLVKTMDDLPGLLQEVNDKRNVVQADVEKQIFDPSYGIKRNSTREYQNAVIKHNEYNLINAANSQQLDFSKHIDESLENQDAVFFKP